MEKLMQILKGIKPKADFANHLWMKAYWILLKSLKLLQKQRKNMESK